MASQIVTMKNGVRKHVEIIFESPDVVVGINMATGKEITLPRKLIRRIEIT
jgi:hypothetical protein